MFKKKLNVLYVIVAFVLLFSAGCKGNNSGEQPGGGDNNPFTPPIPPDEIIEEIEEIFEGLEISEPTYTRTYAKLTAGIADGSIYADENGYYEMDGNYYCKYTTPSNVARGKTFYDGARIEESTAYFFKVEPVRWRILSKSGGKAFVLSEQVLDTHVFNDAIKETTVFCPIYGTVSLGVHVLRDDDSTYATNWQASQMREWLNGDFYNTLFALGGGESVITTEVDNGWNTVLKTSAADMLWAVPENIKKHPTVKYNPAHYDPSNYSNANTQDKIFLASYADVTNSSYGFSHDYKEKDGARVGCSTDFSLANGLRSSEYNAGWLLRSSHVQNGLGTDCVSMVSSNGMVYGTMSSNGSFGITPTMNDLSYTGVRPAMWVDLSGDDYEIEGDTLILGYYPQARVSPTEQTIASSEAWKLSLGLQSNGKTVKIVKKAGTTYPKNLILPAEYNGLPVTEIEKETFKGATGLKSVAVPDSVKTIGDNAFSGCTGLKQITIGSGTTSIGANAFEGCTGLTEIIIPDSVTSIGANAFEGCTGLTEITIGSGTTSIGASAFKGCTGLMSINYNAVSCSDFSSKSPFFSDDWRKGSSITVTIGADVTKIPNYLFCDLSKITNVVFETDSKCTSIGNAAFSDCDGLTSITIPDSVTSIGGRAFSYCKGLTSITIPDSVASIGSSAFSYCNGLTSINVSSGNTKYHSEGNCLIETATGNLIQGCNNSIIPADGSVTSIGNSAFALCYDLTEITIPDSVTSIGEDAFSSCTGLTDLSIGKSVTSIGDSAFSSCIGLTSINYNAVRCPGDYFSLMDSGYVGMNGNGITVTIGADVTEIPDRLFLWSSKITKVVFETNSKCTSIGDYAFDVCYNLTEITIPTSVTNIGEAAFGCSYLSKVYYGGANSTQWFAITINMGNDDLKNATRYYYSESAIYDGAHWRYVDGVPTVWEQ